MQRQNQYRPQGNAHDFQQQGQRDQPSNHQSSMSTKEMLKKIMADQAQLVANVRINKLATQNLEKQFGSLLVPRTHDLKEVYQETVILIPTKWMR